MANESVRHDGIGMRARSRALRYAVPVATFAWALFLVAESRPAAASSGGIHTASFLNAATACNSNGCHAPQSSPVPTVVLSGPTEVPPGSVNVYTLTIATTRSAGGFNVSTPTGTLSTGGPDAAMTKIVSSRGSTEVTHSQPKNAVSGVVAFSFRWTAPASFTSATLLGWGNAVNRNGFPTGDGAASAMLTIVSSGDPTATPTATSTPSDTMTATPTATASASATPDVDRADVNCDDAASAADATAFVQSFGSAVPGACDADVDGDGSLTAADLADLVRAIFGD